MINYARLSQLKPGDFVRVDDGFTCIPPHARRKVIAGQYGLYIRCGGPANSDDDLSARQLKQVYQHGLDGQLAQDGDTLVGVYKVEANQ